MWDGRGVAQGVMGMRARTGVGVGLGGVCMLVGGPCAFVRVVHLLIVLANWSSLTTNVDGRSPSTR